MASDAPKATLVIGPRTGLARDRLRYPRLVPSEPRVPVSRQPWLATAGNTLLEAPWLAWCIFDIAVLSLGVYIGYEWFVWVPGGAWIKSGWLQTSMVQCPALVLAGMIFGIYEQQTLLRGSRIAARSLLTAGACVLITYAFLYIFMYSMQSRGVLFLAAGMHLALAGPLRVLVGWSTRGYSRKFIIVGTDRRSWLSPASQGEGLSRRYRLLGYVTIEPVEAAIGRDVEGQRVLGSIDDLEDICTRYDVREIVVGPVASRNARVLEKTLDCLKLGCRVTNLSTFYEQVMSEVPVAHLEPNWFLFADLKHYREAQLIMKRAFDIFGAVVGLLLTLPFWPLIALAIRLDSDGPVFYHQERVGLNRRTFRLHKFRTMIQSAERDGHQWASLTDPRVTRVGWYLRKTRLDELPQLWNILIGQMSIVGPRPERPEFVQELAPKIRFYNERHLIKPGLTGWAQINYRYGASVDDARRKLQLDLWYLKHMSIELDAIIMFRTFGTMFLGSR